MRTGLLLLGLLVSSLSPRAVRAGEAPARIDTGSIRRFVSPAVCRVTVEDYWRIPSAVATGFLLGDGKFVISDLGAVARPGAERVRLLFPDGLELTAGRFGLADPSLGLVALRIDASGPVRPGLPLAPTLPALDGIGAVAAAGWQWGKDLAVVTGRVWRGPAIRDVAGRAGIETPAGVDSFLRMDGGRIEAASGAPVVDAGGTVLAVRLDVAARNVNVALAMPASTLRRSLLEGKPTLRPLADLPEPLWPVDVVRLPGRPPPPAYFAQARNDIRAAAVCTTCNGKGEVEGDEVRGLLRRRRGLVECPKCHGEGIAPESGLYEQLTTWAEGGTRVVWAPGGADRTRVAARTAGTEMVRWLALGRQHFREAYSEHTGGDLNMFVNPAPRGMVIYAQVRDTVTGPGGTYVILDPQHTTQMIAVGYDDLMGRGGKGPSPKAKPAEKAWILLAGTALAPFDTGRYRGVFVLPFEWVRCPPPGVVKGPAK